MNQTRTVNDIQNELQTVSERLSALSTKASALIANIAPLDTEKQTKLLKSGGLVSIITSLINWIGVGLDALQPPADGSDEFAQLDPNSLAQAEAAGMKAEALIKSTQELLELQIRMVNELLESAEKDMDWA